MTDASIHEKFMQLACDSAVKGWGKTHPNPVVGAVLVEDGEVVAEGAHLKAGDAHAERAAFANLGRKPKENATIYITLEPCSTHGRTPPCTDLLLESGIKNVVVGAEDPNPDHRGRGLDILRDAGIEVTSGVLAETCEDLNIIFNYKMLNGEPLFAGKIATTIDGRIATRDHNSRWITGPEARQDVQRWRRYFPAIAVGAGTVKEDDPWLTSRRDGEEEWCPRRFVFDRALLTASMERQIFSDHYRDRTTVVTVENADSDKLKSLIDSGIEVWQLPPADDGKVSFAEFSKKCSESGIDGVIFEGGGGLLGSLIKQRKMHYLFAYRAPKFFADEESVPSMSGLITSTMDDAFALMKVRHSDFGDDQLMRGYVVS